MLQHSLKNMLLSSNNRSMFLAATLQTNNTSQFNILKALYIYKIYKKFLKKKNWTTHFLRATQLENERLYVENVSNQNAPSLPPNFLSITLITVFVSRSFLL